MAALRLGDLEPIGSGPTVRSMCVRRRLKRVLAKHRQDLLTFGLGHVLGGSLAGYDFWFRLVIHPERKVSLRRELRWIASFTRAS